MGSGGCVGVTSPINPPTLLRQPACENSGDCREGLAYPCGRVHSKGFTGFFHPIVVHLDITFQVLHECLFSLNLEKPEQVYPCKIVARIVNVEKVVEAADLRTIFDNLTVVRGALVTG